MKTYEEILNGYHGSAIKPEAFDTFWCSMYQKAQVAALNYTVTEAAFSANSHTKYYEIRMKGFCHSEIYAKYILPVSDEPVPVVLQFHGYPGASRGWFEQSSFAGLGMAVIAIDCPGQGGYTDYSAAPIGTQYSDHIIMGLDGQPEDFYYTEAFLNTCLAVRLAEALPEIDSSRIYVNGASQGGGLGLVCAALNAGKIRKAAILYPFLTDYRCAYDNGSDSIVFTGMKYWRRWYDPTGAREEEMFTKLGYIDALNFADRITCPVLFGTGLKDVLIPPKAQLAAYAAMKCEKQLVIYPDYGHEEIPDFDERIINFFSKEEI